MNSQKAVEIYQKIEADAYSMNLFARANARYILFGVEENRENFPGTLEYNLNSGSDSLAFTYLSIGCALAEGNIFNEQTKKALEKGAEFIEYNHLPIVNRCSQSKYYLLVGALAYYASAQYSKAFILMKEADRYETDISILISSFLKKDFDMVNTILNRVLLDQNDYLDLTDETFVEKANHPHIVILAKSITNLMDYLYTGNEIRLSVAQEILMDLIELLEIDQEPGLWWIARILKIITSGFGKSSLWANIKPLIPDSEIKLVDKFIFNMIFGPKTIVELFTAQLATLPLIVQNKGGVISLPTSSGKTQIAILAILKALTEKPDSKVFYIAPYRSLAYEIETALKNAFEILNFEISQLYGSGQFDKLDKMQIEDANILIATPEKAKVILRANQEITSIIDLVVIDEGHLIDASQRNVRNELFIDELKLHVRKNGGKILLLSAVLPNTSDMARWIAEDETLCATEKERLARQRLGILDFGNNTVSLEWMGDEKSYNNKFIRPILPTGRKKLIQPKDKATAIAMTALRLSAVNKTVLIFTSRAKSVNTYAKAVEESLKILKDDYSDHFWSNANLWEELKLLCSEYDSKDNKRLLKYAELGILCHYGGLNKDIRNVLERLMKEANPRIIVATMTLGQGVNLGVSTVILADTDFYNRDKKSWIPITHNEVWNIIGRAGRAFQDIEGKILFAVTKKDERDIAINYIENPPKDITSGLLQQIRRIKNLAEECKIDFDRLLELISENDFAPFETYYFKKTGVYVNVEFLEIFDWIDDTLLSLDNFALEFDLSLDDLFRSSLAYLQAKEDKIVSGEQVIEFLSARHKALDKMIPENSSRSLLSTSSLPLASAIALEENFDEIIILGNEFLESNQSFKKRVNLLKSIEMIISTFPSLTFRPALNDKGELSFPSELVDEARQLWLSGKNLSEGSDLDKIIKLTNQHFSYTISWVLGAISNKCKINIMDDLADLFENLAVSCELGLPDSISSKIYLAGIHSRIATMEIANSDIFTDPFVDEMTISEVRRWILDNFKKVKKEVKNDITIKWLSILERNTNVIKPVNQEQFKDFTITNQPKLSSNRFYVKSIDGETYFLCNHDYSEVFEIESSKEWPFYLFSNKMDRFFNVSNGNWSLNL
ncbi:DEAD/DEAH box helicase [Sphingobacterium siyangense]|uniref:DEAD/DEAH box helicase n=1 Tax=Sphingobacterium siyangense TaxID=459529 RepID=UPI002FDA73AD